MSPDATGSDPMLAVPVPMTDLFGRAGREQLASRALRPVVASRLAASLRLIDNLGREIITADRELQVLFRGERRVVLRRGQCACGRRSRR